MKTTINKSVCKILYVLIAFCGVHSLVASARTGYYNCQSHYCCNPTATSCNKNGWPAIQILSAPGTLATKANPAPQGYSGKMDALNTQTTYKVSCYGVDTPATVIFTNVSSALRSTVKGNSVWGKGAYSYHNTKSLTFTNKAGFGSRQVSLAMVTCNKP